ncbi:CLUMA_CG005433, isoform A [Clunio marinus]|uniref:CLUMA_CG005433, isoform A n=1 Tax=Clunio marinus TaxID=568069 RepID=A0A1J1HUQ9_9DIPT|nr:CLUMA_CG005433, isoform A [Clunio marinus]
MYGHDTNAIRSRYDYYYSVSSPSLSQAANYYENQASLFGEPIAPLLPPPIQKSPSPSRIQTPLTPFNNTHNASTSSSAVTNYTTTGVHPPLIENFDNHLLESIRRNILDQQNNNLDVTNALTKHQLWTQNSNSSTNSPPNETSDGGANFEGRRKRARTAFGNYKSDDDVSQNKYRTLSAHSDMKAFTRLSMETTSDTDNNNGPTRVFFKNNKSNNSTRHETTSNSSSSKLNHSVGLSKIPRMKPTTVKKKEKVPFTMVKSKSDLNSLKTYPDSFTIVTSPKRSPSAGYNPNKRSKSNDDDDDSIMEFEWIKPPPEKLYEAASVIDKYVDDEPPYMTEHFGARLSIPTSPIVTNKIMIGSTNRVPPGSFQSHKKIAFAIINDYKNRRTRMLQHRHSEDNMSFSGRFSPYSRYIMQREMSAPSLNRVESLESDDGEFYYFVDDDNEVESGRQTSIGFVHKKQMSASMSSLNRRRPQSEMRKLGPRYMSTPNFIKINKRAVIQSTPMEKVNPRLILHRSLKGVLKVYNNTNIKTTRRFSLNNMDIFLPNGKIDPNLLAPMPINVEDKRSEKLEKHQVKAQKKRVLVMKRRKLSPIAGTPNKDSKEKEDENKTPKRKMNTPKTRLEERLKKDKFGRLVTPKKAALPNFKATGAKKSTKKTKSDGKEKEDEETAAGTTAKEQEDEKKAMNFLQQIQARNVLGRTIKARIAARQPPPLTRQPSKQSIESLFQDKPPPLKKKSSFSSLKSLSASIRTVTSFKTNKSNSIEDEEAEAGDEITKLQSLKDTKKDGKSKVKSSILAKTKVLGLTSRLTSASSTRSQKEVTVPPPSRTASKTSILSRVSSKLQLDDGKQAQDTPSKKSDVIRVPSATSIMSMTTAAITANPLNTTLTITNQLATQGAEINEKKRAAMEKQSSIDEGVIASHPDADKGSMSSQKTVSSQKTNTSRGGSRKTSAKHSGKNSAEKPRSRASSILGAVVGVNSAIRYLRKQKSKDSIDSVTSDAPQVTSGPGAGAENNDSIPIAGKILEKSQQSLEKVQKTVDKATSEIHHTINENLSNLRKLEKKLSGGNLLEHDANNNDVEKNLSRQSTKQDIAGSSRTTNIAHMSASKMRMDKDGMSVNAISVAPDERSGLQHQSSDESNQTNSSTRLAQLVFNGFIICVGAPHRSTIF